MADVEICHVADFFLDCIEYTINWTKEEVLETYALSATKILFIGDSSPETDALITLLRVQGYTITHISDRYQMQKITEASTPDLVIMAHTVSGNELDEVKRHIADKHIPLLLIATDPDSAEALPDDIWHLTRPFRIRQLLVLQRDFQ